MRSRRCYRGQRRHPSARAADDRLPRRRADATQEILVKVLTRLSTFHGQAAFTTWVHRVAVNHLLDRKRSAVERYEMSFGVFADDLHDGLTAAPDSSPELDVLAREVKHGCTLALLTCLDREARVAYVLGEVFGVSSRDGAWICETSEAAYRQRLSRARAAVRSFVTAHCGLVSPTRRAVIAVAASRSPSSSAGSTPPSPTTRRRPTSTRPSPRWNASTTPPRCCAACPTPSPPTTSPHRSGPSSPRPLPTPDRPHVNPSSVIARAPDPAFVACQAAERSTSLRPSQPGLGVIERPPICCGSYRIATERGRRAVGGPRRAGRIESHQDRPPSCLTRDHRRSFAAVVGYPV